MKWKVGAALMALVFVVGMIPVVLSAGSSGSLTSVLSGDHEIVMQVDDKRALLDGKEVTLVDDAGSATPPRRDEMVTRSVAVCQHCGHHWRVW